MTTRCLVVLGLAALTTACESAPIAPSVITAASAPSVSTTRPDVWDSRDELAGWVTNGLSSGPVTVVGDGDDAVIQVDVNGADVRLVSPRFDPLVRDLRTLRVRYQWLDGTNGQYAMNGQYLSLELELQVPSLDLSKGPPYLFIIVPKTAAQAVATGLATVDGPWLKQDFTANIAYSPPFTARGAVLSISGNSNGVFGKGQLKIDRIELVRH